MLGAWYVTIHTFTLEYEIGTYLDYLASMAG